ncbi:DUF3592 domain-containing protein [Emticicia sp. W12TSBA100-4]|uniref:DUF3592 domain-containing protein n=1 Tax=Emticicia sp. W12TSBA100-4 TaxID=3160965 RepID=UPI0033057465
MIIKNKKVVGMITTTIGLGIVLFWGNTLIKMLALPFSGVVADAKVIGFKTKGSKWITENNNSGRKNILSGKSPFFEFSTSTNEKVRAYSESPQIFNLFNYQIDEELTIAYPLNEPNKAIILDWREVPGLLLMVIFGTLAVIIGISYLANRQTHSLN